jgi:hypothetical protein
VSPDRAKERENVLRRCRTRVRSGTGPRDNGLCNGLQVGLGYAEVAQAIEPAKARELG